MSKAKPTVRQQEFQDWEFGVFLHFGIRTFYEDHCDWDGKENDMQAESFMPAELDCEQWAASVAAAGAKYMVLTAKHHDGFANWPSKFTDFSVASSPWENGKGDVVREYVDACHKYNLNVGLYYSPADATSPYYSSPEVYDDYFIKQISELLGGDYGTIDMLWFDGCGSENHEYDWGRIIKEIRSMQPEILIFSLGDPDYRWVGNECGLAHSPQFNTVDEVLTSVRTTDKKLVKDNKSWLPAECDFKMRQNWFWREEDNDTVKTPEELLGIYYYSVGRGSNMLLNIGPDNRGLLPEKDVQSLQAMGDEIKQRFSSSLGNISNFKNSENSWTCKFSEYLKNDTKCHEKNLLINHVVIQEDLSDGENIQQFKISIIPYLHGEPVTVYHGYSVGHKIICQFPLVRCRGVIVEVLKHDDPVKLRKIDLFNTQAYSENGNL
ncbi:MAG: alpha-L-fucosidase [Victivallaceae bacterium]|nr:alpha-L-fucosidase [Victivallaceae bacterium]